MLLQSLGLVLLGGLAGVLAGLFGIGGGIIIVPSLVLLMGFSQHTASGTSLIALLLPVGILGVLAYYKAGKIGPEHLKYGLLVAFGLFLGAYLGAKLAVSLPEQTVRRAFAVFIVAVAVKLWFGK